MMTDVKINAGINANERIDDLCRDNLRLIQNTEDVLFWNGCCVVVYICEGRKEPEGA